MSSLKPMQKPTSKTVRRRAAAKQAAKPDRRSLYIFYGLLGVAAILIAFMVIRGRANAPVAPSDISVEQAVRPLNAPTGQTTEGFWFKGQPDAPVTVTVFGDFQCPACQATFQQLEDDLDQRYVEAGKVKFVFHDFPLTSIHANAHLAAQAARAAGAQGKFWPFHDVLYARQAEWENDRDPTARFKSYAAELGLDQQAFDRALDDETYADVIDAAMAAGRQQGISSTPTYLVDGQRIETTALFSAIDAALQAKGR